MKSNPFHSLYYYSGFGKMFSTLCSSTTVAFHLSFVFTKQLTVLTMYSLYLGLGSKLFVPSCRKFEECERNEYMFYINILYPSIFWVIQLRRMGWVGHVALWRRGEVYKGFWWGNLKEGDHLENPGVDGMIILKVTF
jgi:hypothetical protein